MKEQVEEGGGGPGDEGGRKAHSQESISRKLCLTKFVGINFTNHSYGSSTYQHLTYPFLLQT